MFGNFFAMLFLFGSASFGPFAWWYHNWFPPPPVYSYGGLSVDWGVPDGSPIFVVANMLPGDTETRTITVTNGSPHPRVASIWATETSPHTIFPDVLTIAISENASDVYGGTSSTGPKTVTQFYADGGLPPGIPLSSIAAGATTQYVITVHFPPSSGNEYQKLQTIFDLKLGIKKKIPPQCKDKKFSGPPIFGTQNGETIYGTEGNDLIYALEGNDTVYGGGGHDCIIGGPGDDDIHGDDGDDEICKDDEIEDNGKDRTDGGRGRDYCSSNARYRCER